MAIWNVTDHEYHADREHVSRSALEIFRQSPKLYQKWKNHEWESPQTASQRLGAAFHCNLLQPEIFSQEYMKTEFSDRRTKKYKEFALQHLNVTLLTTSEILKLRKMMNSVEDNPVAMDLLKYNQGLREQAYKFTDDTMLQCKFKVDYYHNGTIVELKTTQDVSEQTWCKSAYNFGYHRQAAFYTKGIKILQHFNPNFLFVVVGTTEPYECIVREFDSLSVTLGMKEINSLLKDLSMRLKTNDFCPLGHNKINWVSLPSWCFSKGP